MHANTDKPLIETDVATSLAGIFVTFDDRVCVLNYISPVVLHAH